MPSKIEAFKCDFCGKLLKYKHTAKIHEASCNHNPEKRHCITCIHGIKAIDGYVVIDQADNTGVEVYGCYCGYHDKPIKKQPFFIECDTSGGFDCGFGVLPESPIPFSCWHYESKGKAEWTPQEQYEVLMREREAKQNGRFDRP